MRIVIEIDGVELVLKAEQPQVAAEVVPEVSTSTAQAGLVLPSKLLKAATALKAEDAGPAPSESAQLRTSNVPISAAYSITSEESGAMDAGPGPHPTE